MNKLIIIFLLTLILSNFTKADDVFVGKIIYTHTFTDLKGNDITNNLTPYFGRKLHYFINENNYKSYDDKINLSQLYHSETNTYYAFKNGKIIMKFDAFEQTSKKFIVRRLGKVERIAGYDCEAIEVQTDDSTTIYYHSSLIKTDPKTFSKHNFGEWNRYLEATNGALSLKFVTTDSRGFIWTSVASEISKQNLSAKDFEIPLDAGLTK